MQGIARRFTFLFRSTHGLVLVAIAMIALTTAFFGMISGPMADLGIRDVWVRLTGMSLLPAERELGMSLTAAYQLVPEQSTAAIVLHHPQAKYYSVGESRVEQLMK